jgi:prepilin-type N-terminal cleavage/methylation domain-containing protein
MLYYLPMRLHRHNAQSSHGFSLVELSIVLVILGLLVGGILSGKSLIRASELRTVYTQAHGFATAASAFRDKYFYIPGDMPNATQFWGSAGGTGSDAPCFNTVSTTAATCNGNGNGAIDDVAAAKYESYRAWQQMANASLIQGSYSGTLNGVHGSSNSQ